MRLVLSPRFWQRYAQAPVAVQRAFDKQSRLLAYNIRHPSLHAKKYDEGQDIWQARLNRSWRFYFAIRGDTYVILTLQPHPK